MAVRVEFDEKLRQWASGAEGVDVKTTTVHGALIEVAKAYPSFRMFNCDGELRSILRFRKNGQPVAVSEPLTEGDTVQLSASDGSAP